MVTSMLGVRCTPPVKKGLVQQIRQPTAVYCCCCCLSAAASRSVWVENLPIVEGVFVGEELFTKKRRTGVFHVTYSARRGGKSNHLIFTAKPATFNAPSNGTVLGGDPGMRCIVPTAPQPKVREINLGRRRATRLTKKCILFVYIHSIQDSPSGCR